MVKKESRAKEPVTREYTVNLHKKILDVSFKRRAPRAMKEIRSFAAKVMGTKDVRLDVKLNKAVWSKGIRNVPTRVRVVISRRRNDDEDAKVCGQLGTLAGWDA
jgi:large subunit ribosomal protein L31e